MVWDTGNENIEGKVDLKSAMTKAHDEFNTLLDIHIRKILFKLYKA